MLWFSNPTIPSSFYAASTLNKQTVILTTNTTVMGIKFSILVHESTPTREILALAELLSPATRWVSAKLTLTTLVVSSSFYLPLLEYTGLRSLSSAHLSRHLIPSLLRHLIGDSTLQINKLTYTLKLVSRIDPRNSFQHSRSYVNVCFYCILVVSTS